MSLSRTGSFAVPASSRLRQLSSTDFPWLLSWVAAEDQRLFDASCSPLPGFMFSELSQIGPMPGLWQNPWTPEPILEQLVSSLGPLDAARVAANPGLGLKARQTVLADASPEVIEGLARNPALTFDELWAVRFWAPATSLARVNTSSLLIAKAFSALKDPAWLANPSWGSSKLPLAAASKHFPDGLSTSTDCNASRSALYWLAQNPIFSWSTVKPWLKTKDMHLVAGAVSRPWPQVVYLDISALLASTTGSLSLTLLRTEAARRLFQRPEVSASLRSFLASFTRVDDLWWMSTAATSEELVEWAIVHPTSHPILAAHRFWPTWAPCSPSASWSSWVKLLNMGLTPTQLFTASRVLPSWESSLDDLADLCRHVS